MGKTILTQSLLPLTLAIFFMLTDLILVANIACGRGQKPVIFTAKVGHWGSKSRYMLFRAFKTSEIGKKHVKWSISHSRVFYVLQNMSGGELTEEPI